MSAAYAEERRALLDACDAVNAARTPHREPRNWRTEHALMQATIDARSELARATARIAPPPTGSREIPGWLLAVLLVLAAFAIATFAPGANAAPATPINCQGDQEYYWQIVASAPGAQGQWWTDCGYRYELPAAPVIALPPIIDPPTTPVPEPATWLLFAAGLVALIAARRLRKGPQA